MKRDNEKKELCKKHGVNYIQIYAHNGEVDSEDITEPNFVLYTSVVDKTQHDKKLKEIVSFILQQFGHSITEVDFELACKEAFDFMHDIENNNIEKE